MPTGTVAPVPRQQFFDNSGRPLSGGKLYTYAAGLTTPLATYSDSALAIPNANPLSLDAAGRATIYLGSAAYRFVLTDASDVQVWAQDNVLAVAPYNVDLDIDGVAGEALSAHQAVYMADGTGGTTAGQWYRTDASTAATSSLASMVGMVPQAVTAGASGTVRLLGRLTGLTGVVAGAVYYCSDTAGAITSTPPVNSRLVGVADSTTSLVLYGAAAGNQITVSGISFVPLESSTGNRGDIVATINASTEGLVITGNLIQINGTTTFSAGYNPTTKVAAGGAAADVNAGVTTIDGPRITTGTITTAHLNFTPTTSANVIASINASSEGIQVNANKLTISGLLAGQLQTASSGARVSLQPTSPQLAWYNSGGTLIGGIYDDQLRIAASAVINDYLDPNGILIGPSASTAVKLRGYSRAEFVGDVMYGELAVDAAAGDTYATLTLRRGATQTLTLNANGFSFAGGDLLPATDGAQTLGSPSQRFLSPHLFLTSNAAPTYVVVNKSGDNTALGYLAGHTGTVVISGTTLTFKAGVLTGVA